MKKQAGVSLVELILFIVILGICLRGALSAMVTASALSIDPLKIQQAVSIAEGYMQEIMTKDFADPYEVTISEEPRAVPACVERPSMRFYYDNVCDYQTADGVSEAIVDHTGAPIHYLSDFTVSVNVEDDFAWQGVPEGDVMKVTIDVYYEGEVYAQLSSYRTRYGY